MAESEQASIFSRIRRMSAEVRGASDAQLLGRFAANRDEAAFELLLWRHARLVFGVCRRVLHDLHDAEDAFQATFLALARHAGRIARREAVAGWLHRVAYRTALTARGQRIRRDRREKLGPTVDQISVPPDAGMSLENQELQRLLDQEIRRLPERFRAAVVLCYLEGKSVEEAALLLGCPRGTVASRLARGRERLRVRLAGRGLTLTVALAVLRRANATPGPFARIPTLLSAAVRYAAGGAVADGVLPPRITALTEEVLRVMFLHKLRKGILVLMVLLGLLLAGGGFAVGLRAKGGPETEPPNKGEASAAEPAERGKDKSVAAPPRAVTVRRPMRREAAPYQDYTGVLDARRVAEIRPAVSGFVQEVRVKAGDEVKKGDVLFKFDSRVPQLVLDKAEAALKEAEAIVEKHKSEIDRWDSEVKRLRREVERNIVGQGVLRESEHQFRGSKAAKVAAEAAVQTAKIEVLRARLDLEATILTAPMSGQVGRILVEPGTLVFRGQDRATLLTTVTSLDPISLVFEMDERSFLHYQRLLREKKVKGTGSSLHMRLTDENGFPHEGTLESFENHVGQGGTVRVCGCLPNPDRLLLPGMSVRVRMTVGPSRAVLEVPEEAILSDQGEKYVLVVNERNLAERRAVTVGQADGERRIIEKGLRAEDRVVVSGLRGIRPGDPVEPRKKDPPERANPGRDRNP